ncbi:hypothetical protein B0H14DRAFT_3046237 [Mycena olivaceomarginata]|nr:hypothetical protein B0H14DRAFT_3046237 [Mycena olivaceomarginata]
MTAPITLFDLDSKVGGPLSPWVLPIRLLLNYKQIPYKTTWVNFPDIAKVLTAAGAPPTRTGTAPYTVPAIVDGEKAISDSRKIAEYLERSYPDTTGPSSGGAQESAINAFAARAYYIETRRVMLGKELHEIDPPSQHEGRCALLKPLSRSPTAGWIFGKNGPVYEDFQLIGCGSPGLWDHIKDLNDGKWNGLLKAAEPYTTLD